MSGLRERARRWLDQRLGYPRIDLAMERLRRCEFVPNGIVDVGAYRGDFAAMVRGVWPTANVVCFEPLAARAAEIRQRFAQNPGVKVIEAVVGARSGEEVVLHEAETASSVLDEHVPQGFHESTHRTITLDEVLGMDQPVDLIKLDVQGYELQVLRGSEASLRRARALLLELNLLDIHRGVPLLHEVMAWLSERGWVAYDLCGQTRRPLDGALWQVDMLFVPVASPLRSDKRWSRA